jgi:hypothetical protein
MITIKPAHQRGRIETDRDRGSVAYSSPETHGLVENVTAMLAACRISMKSSMFKNDSSPRADQALEFLAVLRQRRHADLSLLLATTAFHSLLVLIQAIHRQIAA